MHLLALFFVIDGSHAKKRLLAFDKNVEKLSIVSYYRNKNIKYANHYNLGKSPKKQYFLRFLKIIFDIPRLLHILRNNPDVNTIYAWNFDIALLFRLSSIFISRKFTFVYEVADIKTILLANSFTGRTLRNIEQFILNNTDILCVTSNDFVVNYFHKYFTVKGQIHLLENKVCPVIENITINTSPIDETKWKIGFFGLIRCRKSLKLLHRLANKLPDLIEIVLAGKPEELIYKEFKDLEKLPNTTFLGEYSYPQDLQNIYSKIDIVWSADFSDPSKNSEWLLPNRIYEAGLFSVPQICFEENKAISSFIKSLKIGWIFEETHLEQIIDFIKNLDEDEFKNIKTKYLQLPANQFSGDDQIIELLHKINPAS